MPRVLAFKPSLGRKIILGIKTTTIRLDPFKKGERVLIKSGNVIIGEAEITNVKKVKIRDLSTKDIIKEGFYTKEALIRFLSRVYGKRINLDDEVYLIEFKLCRGRDSNPRGL